LNQSLATAYYLKEELRQFWSHDDKEKAEAFLNDWIARAQATKIEVLKSFARTLSSHREGHVDLLRSPDRLGSTGGVEQQDQNLETASLWVQGS
jgi:transposase